ncbi:esterase-like [Gossypium australe]|uniref:Esterase-like n=1 Tax=Gossypium australe TaxID=47621 RepID=A0A5B6V9G0_9ROSI|nr:esterase-like [Gossypium australe]
MAFESTGTRSTQIAKLPKYPRIAKLLNYPRITKLLKYPHFTKSVPEWLRANGAEVFRGITGVAPSSAEYWLEAVERIMDDLDFAEEEKLKGVVSLLRDEAYQ